MPMLSCVTIVRRELLEGIADYERKIGLESFKTSFAQRAQLQPLQSGGREKLLQQVNIIYVVYFTFAET